MLSKTNHQFVIAAFAAVVLAAAVPQAGYAAGAVETGTWKLNVEQSKFGPGANTLVIERAGDAKASTQGNVTSATTSGGTFLVISNGKVYLATDDYAALSSGIRQVNYSLWRGMRLVQIGDKVRASDYCGFRCQSGLPDNRMTITFIAKDNIDMSKQRMNDIVVLNK